MYVKNQLNMNINHSNVHGYITRNRFNLVNNICTYNKPYKSFYGSGIKFFNHLPAKVRELSPNSLKIIVKQKLILNGLYSIEDYFNVKF